MVENVGETYKKKITPQMKTLTFLFAFGLLVASPLIRAESTVLKFGTTTALTGPAKALGKAMVKGMQAYFKEVNASGGISGRTFELIALDDGYDPRSAELQMKKLIEDYNVLAVIGNVGTPTATKTVPLANRHNVPLIGAFTGASLLRKRPPDRYIVNYRASYDEEMATIVNALLDQDIHPERIAFFTQDDSYGDAGYQGAIKALKKHGFRDDQKLAHGRYTRNTLHVEEGLAEIINAKLRPRAVIMVGTYGPTAKFIRTAQKILPETLFVSISFVGAHALAQELNGCCDDVFVSQVVPPITTDLPAVRAFKKAFKKYYDGHAKSHVSLEGYLVAKLVTEAVRQADTPVTRESLIDTLESLHELDIGIGINLSYSAEEHQGSHHVWLTRIDDTNVVASEWALLRR
jgi:ABC-type branched-subunit amino acid transport system substrate-binding protein